MRLDIGGLVQHRPIGLERGQIVFLFGNTGSAARVRSAAVPSMENFNI